MKKPKTVDDYIAAQPAAVQQRLSAIRQIVLKNAPDATEKLSYGMPYYSLNGRLIYFAAHKNHIGLYPMKSGVEHFKHQLTDYETSPGTIQFPNDKPLPLDLITEIVVYRISQATQK